jgi:hypothetical protein
MVSGESAKRALDLALEITSQIRTDTMHLKANALA